MNKKINNTRTNLLRKVTAFLLIAVSIILALWPLFFMSDVRQYPECIANDLFPVNNGYPSNKTDSFIYFIQLPMAALAVIAFSLSLTLLRKKYFEKSFFVKTFIASTAVLSVFWIIVVYAGFDMTYSSCADYSANKLPDLNLIIDSRQ